MSNMMESSKADATSYTTPGITNKRQESHETTTESSDKSTVIIIVAATVIFVLAVIIAIFVILMQMKKRKKKLKLAAELEKEEEQERKRRRARKKFTPKRTPRKKKGKGTPKVRKFSKPKSREEMIMKLSDFLETQAKKYGTPNEASVGSAEPTPAPTPTVTPALLSSEAEVSFECPAADDSRLQKLSQEVTDYPQKSKQSSKPEMDEKEAAVDRTPPIEWLSEKSAKKSAEAPFAAAPGSSNITSKPVSIDSRPTPTAIEKGLKETESQETWDLESAEKEGYPDKSIELWEEKLQKAEKAEKENERSRGSQEKGTSKEPRG